MPRHPTRPLIPALALIAFTLFGRAVPSVAERPEATPGFVSPFRDLLSLLWSENGSILDPDGTPGASSRPGAEPAAPTSGDNGSGLDPNG
jgi:hypothetical protein